MTTAPGIKTKFTSTRDGRNFVIWFDEQVGDNDDRTYPLLGHVEGEGVCSWTADGVYELGKECDLDLIATPVVTETWVVLSKEGTVFDYTRHRCKIHALQWIETNYPQRADQLSGFLVTTYKDGVFDTHRIEVFNINDLKGI